MGCMRAPNRGGTVEATVETNGFNGLQTTVETVGGHGRPSVLTNISVPLEGGP